MFSFVFYEQHENEPSVIIWAQNLLYSISRKLGCVTVIRCPTNRRGAGDI
jgi:hypothetical protein